MTATLYEHRPTRVEAVQWRGIYNDFPVSWRASGAFQLAEDGTLHVVTAKGLALVEAGDYALQYSWGEFSAVKEAIFLMSYQAVPS